MAESHANQLERNIEISANLGLVMYIFVFGSWALLLFTKINYKQTLFNLIASGAVIGMLFSQEFYNQFSMYASSFVLGIMFYTQWVLPWKEEDPKEVHS